MKNPIARIVSILIVCIIISRVFWFLGYVPNSFKHIINPGDCSGVELKSLEMYFCSAMVAFKTLAGPIIFMIVLFVFRKQVFKQVKRLQPLIPKDYRFLLIPAVSTLIFTIVWSGSHYTTSRTAGLIDQRNFPALIGIFSYVTTYYYKQIQVKLANFFEKRDKIPKILRYGIAFLTPILISLIITYQSRVTHVTVKEQLIVVISLISGYLVLVPKKGAINLKNIKSNP
jgi:hypothetical protein